MDNTSSMRKSDKIDKLYFRFKSRIICQEGNWFLQTRESKRGPFGTRGAAEQELKRFLETIEFVEDHEPSLPSDVDWSDVTIVDVQSLPGDIQHHQ